MADSVSNRTMIALGLLSLVIALLGVWMLYGKVETSGLASNPTGTVNAVIPSAADIFLVNSTVNFGNVGVGFTFVTNGNYSNASQFLLRNDGSVNLNVTISATALFNSTSGNNSNYRFNVTNASGNTSMKEVCMTAQNTWTTIPLSSSAYALCNLNFTDGNDHARVDIEVTIPLGEAAGAKTSTVTFTATQA